MFKRILIMLCVSGCAYGVSPDPDPVYGSTKGPSSPDSDAGGNSSYDYQDNLPYGCYMEEIHQEPGQPPIGFEICFPVNEPSFKWLVDPPPDGKPVESKR